MKLETLPQFEWWQYQPGPRKIGTFKDGDRWCAIYHTFQNLQKSAAEFGDTRLEAIERLRERYPY